MSTKKGDINVHIIRIKILCTRAVRFQKFYLGSEQKNLGSVRFRLFSKKKNSRNVWTHLCMFWAFLLNRWINLWIFQKNNWNLFMDMKYLFLKSKCTAITITTKISTIWALSTVLIVHKEHNLVIFQTFQPAIRWAFGGRWTGN
jgi:hypothetical protein